MSWPEKTNTDRFRKTGKEERVPRAQGGLKRVAGGAPLAQGYFRAS